MDSALAGSDTVPEQRFAVIIRCHFIDKAILETAAKFNRGGRYDVVFALDGSSGILKVDGFETVSISQPAVSALGLFNGDAELLWKCGDYVLYLARQELLAYSRYWMIEYDAWINLDDPVAFLARIDAQSSADLIATYVEKAPEDWYWRQFMQDAYEIVYRCFFPLIRISAAAIDLLFIKRLAASRAALRSGAPGPPVDWPNDEVFTATTLHNHGFTLADFNDFGEYYQRQSFAYGALAHLDQLAPNDGLLYHPVRRGIHYLRAAERFNSFDAKLIPALLAEAQADGDLHEAIQRVIWRALAGVEDDPARLLQSDAMLAMLTQQHPPAEILGPMILALGRARKPDCIERLREICVEKGWQPPPECHNIALGKPASQSSASIWSHAKDAMLDAQGGNNGVLDTEYGFHTSLETNPWWMVDLKKAYAISEIVIHNRRDLTARLQGFQINLSLDGETWRNVYESAAERDPGEIIRLTLPEQPAARLVRVELPREGILHFVEFQAFGHPLEAGNSARPNRLSGTQPKLGRGALAYRSWNVIRNIGDSISPYLVELMSGAMPYYGRPDQAHLLGAGSIFHLANQHSVIWGSGILLPGLYVPELKAGQLHAVRGAMTAELLRGSGLDLGGIPFGDPGIFADEILRMVGGRTGHAGRGIAVVPHHAEFGHPLFQSLRGSQEVCVVDVCDDSLLPIQQIADAEIVISQSLHGLIFAESLGKPALWIGGGDDEACFKYLDWYTTTENRRTAPVGMDTPFETMLGMAERQYSKIDREALRRAFPAELVTHERASDLVDFRTCRQYTPFVLLMDFTRTSPDAAIENLDFFEQARSAAAVMLEGWAENPYVLAVERGAGILPTPEQARAMVSAMDKMYLTDYAIVAKRDVLEKTGPAMAEIGAGVARFETPPERLNAMLLRPLNEWPASNFVVFGF